MKTLLLIAGLLYSSSLFAQTMGDVISPTVERTYLVEPSTKIAVTTGNLSTASTYSIRFKNISGGELRLGWKKLGMNLPAGWHQSLADRGNNYEAIPEGNRLMSTIEKDGHGFIAPNIFANNTSGTLRLTIAVWDADNPSIADTLTWNITAQSQADVEIATRNNSITTFPNPATEQVTVQLGKPSSGMMSILSSNGTVVLERTVINSNVVSFNLSSLNGGEYVVLFKRDNESMLSAKLIKH